MTDIIDNDEEEFMESALPKDLKHVPYQYVKPNEKELLRRANKFFEITNARRTIRYFDEENVPKEVIRYIIKAAGYKIRRYKLRITFSFSFFRFLLFFLLLHTDPFTVVTLLSLF